MVFDKKQKSEKHYHFFFGTGLNLIMLFLQALRHQPFLVGLRLRQRSSRWTLIQAKVRSWSRKWWQGQPLITIQYRSTRTLLLLARRLARSLIYRLVAIDPGHLFPTCWLKLERRKGMDKQLTGFQNKSRLLRRISKRHRELRECLWLKGCWGLS